MDIFRSISTMFADMFKRHKDADPVNKNNVLDLIDNNLITLRLVISSYEHNPALFEYIKKELLSTRGATSNTVARECYDLYVKSLSSSARQQETSKFFSSIYAATKIVLADHETMRSNFDLLFKGGTDDGEIALDQMKLSHAAIFGFINLSSLLADWFCFFLGQMDNNPDNPIRTPAYRMAVIQNSSKTVADFVTDVLSRGATRGIVYLVQNVRKTGDVSIYTDAATLDSYANINDYPGVSYLMQGFSAFQPILFLREAFGYFSRAKYKRNIAMREWVQAKLVVLQMDADRMDPQSTEYLRKQEILQKYSDELSKLDALIDRYEQM